MNFSDRLHSLGVFTILVLCSLIVLADEDSDIFKPQKDIELPDLTTTYGFDIRPDVSMIKKGNPNKPESDKEHMNSFSTRLKNKFRKHYSENVEYGVQRYTRYTGSKRYGIGVTRKIDQKTKESVSLHEHGITYERDKTKLKYYIGVDSRSPIERNNEPQDDTYTYFGIRATW